MNSKIKSERFVLVAENWSGKSMIQANLKIHKINNYVLNLKIFEEQKIQGKSEIPIQSFGVFVTVKRSEKQRLKKWPEDIHGCIGYWEEHYKKLNKLFEISKYEKGNANNIPSILSSIPP